MSQYLPPNLFALFAPRPPLKYLPPPTKLSHEKPNKGFGTLSDCVKFFEDPKDTPARPKIETKLEKLERKRREKLEIATYKAEQAIAMWNPNENPDATSDPYKTLFVARLNYDTTESKLQREFEYYGTVRKVKIVRDKNNSKSRGYAFVEFKHKDCMRDAYKRSDGRRMDGHRLLVDIERGRTAKGWLPRRLGGGLGGRKAK